MSKSRSIDCADAAKLARFWVDVLGRQVNLDPRIYAPNFQLGH